MTTDSQSAGMESAIYQGFVRHRRFSPVRHEFRYPLFMVFIKLSEMSRLQQKLLLFGPRLWHWARFRRADYIGSQDQTIAASVKSRVAAARGLAIEQLDGEVYFLGHLRYLGFYFSPLNLYFLEHQQRMRYLVAEVSNTPWNQRHYYVIDLQDLAPHDKSFHVSPFNPMDQRYRWQIRPPGVNSDKAMVHLEVLQQNADDIVFDATLVMKRRALNRATLLRVLLSTPAQTLSMVAGIYWQALRLYLKKVPFHRHPRRRQPELRDSG